MSVFFLVLFSDRPWPILTGMKHVAYCLFTDFCGFSLFFKRRFYVEFYILTHYCLSCCMLSLNVWWTQRTELIESCVHLDRHVGLDDGEGIRTSDVVISIYLPPRRGNGHLEAQCEHIFIYLFFHLIFSSPLILDGNPVDLWQDWGED